MLVCTSVVDFLSQAQNLRLVFRLLGYVLWVQSESVRDVPSFLSFLFALNSVVPCLERLVAADGDQ